eukprot:m.184158 g.184158  ORF g.184158 m.184158 type:complete len:145 (+) comp18094_c0_seq4:3001-3435(+)
MPGMSRAGGQNDKEAKAQAVKVAERFAAAELLAEEIVLDRQQVIDFDRRRNENRTALGEMTRRSLKDADKVWMNLGDLIVKIPKPKAQQLVEQDQTTLSEEINRLRDGIKGKVTALNELQGKDMPAGFNLTGMSKKEFSGPAMP